MYTYIMDTPSADPMLRCFYGFCRISAVTIEKHQHPAFITSRHQYQTTSALLTWKLEESAVQSCHETAIEGSFRGHPGHVHKIFSGVCL